MAKKGVKREAVKRVRLPKSDEDRLMAFIATFLSIIGFLIALAFRKENKYVMFYAKQSLVVFIFSLILWVIGGLLGWMPLTGTIIKFGLNLLAFVFWAISWIYALSGEMREVPLIGQYAEKINL